MSDCAAPPGAKGKRTASGLLGAGNDECERLIRWSSPISRRDRTIIIDQTRYRIKALSLVAASAPASRSYSPVTITSAPEAMLSAIASNSAGPLSSRWHP